MGESAGDSSLVRFDESMLNYVCVSTVCGELDYGDSGAVGLDSFKCWTVEDCNCGKLYVYVWNERRASLRFFFKCISDFYNCFTVRP